MFNIHDLVDVGRYPLDLPDSPAYQRMIEDIQNALKEDGCAVLRGFVHDAGLQALIAEADSVADQAHLSKGRTNVYFSKEDTSLPPYHPARMFYDRSNAFIPADNFGSEGPLRSIYAYSGFMPFLREALAVPADGFYRYDDPLADVIVNMVEEGDGFPWHFDTNNFTVTLAIQNAEEGGAFEYVPMLRSSTDENYAGVSAVLRGDTRVIRRLELQPGDLQIFKGRYSLHRVTAMSGARKRYVGIFSFVEQEGMCGGVERTKQLYGRVLPIHYERAGLRADALRD